MKFRIVSLMVRFVMNYAEAKKNMFISGDIAVVKGQRTGENLHRCMCFLCLNLLFIAGFARQVYATSEMADLKRPQELHGQTELSQRLEELISKLRQERSAYYVQKSLYDNKIEQARDNHKILQGELEDLRRQEAEIDEQIRKYKLEVGDLTKQLVSKASLEGTLRKHVEPFLVSQRAAIGNGIPYKQSERIARLDAACYDMNAPSQISMADRLGHIWNYGQEELRLARSSETYTARAKTVDGLSPHARFFRVGQKILGHTTENGRQSAMWLWTPNQKEWFFITDAKQSTQIRSAVEILDHCQGCRLVTLPIALWPRSLNKEDFDASP